MGRFCYKHGLLVSCKIFFFTGLITLLLSTPLIFAQNSEFNRAIVKSMKLNIRKTPSLDSAIVIVVDRGATLEILKKEGSIGSWLTVKYKGHQGYIRNRSQYIKLVQSESKNKKQVKKSQKKQKIKAQIKTQKKMVETFSQKEVEIIERLNEIDYTLNKARLKITALSEEIMHLEVKIKDLNHAMEPLGKAIILNRDYAGQRLRALYKMNMMGKFDAAGLPSSLFDFFLKQNSMKQIIKADYYILDRQNRDLEKFETVEQQLKKQIHAKTNLEIEINGKIRINKKETAKRQLVLKEIRQKKRLSLAAVESLKLAALKLDNKINDMQTEGKQFIINDFSFSSYKGQLSIPVNGKIISRYGPSKSGDYNSFSFQKGIDIKVEKGEPVKSVFKGEVMFAQWLKGYGNLLIINHGDNYYTLYAHVEEIFKQNGESVETGEVIATAGDTGSIKGMCLHFEVRHHGKPVNPMKWLKKGA